MGEHYRDHFEKGMYCCATCGQQLFNSDTKFKSGTAWPSFRDAISGSLTARPDNSHGMVRTEVLCSKCGTHLGHVFPDGKVLGDTHPDAGNRYCVLSDSLSFGEKEEK